jgi:bacillolysin
VGIGKDKAAAITFRSLTQYMGANSGYIAARNHSILSANDLYGSCSNEAMQTANAWYAVGVSNESAFYDLQVCGNLTGAQTKNAIHILSAGTNVGCASTTIINGSNIVFKAAEEIDFLPGFTIENGAEFIAYLDPCSITGLGKSIVNNNTNPEIKEQVETKPSVLIGVDKFVLSPNPNNGNFSLLFNTKVEAGTILVQSMMGQVIFSKTIPNDTETNDISLGEISKGIYFVTYHSENGMVIAQKMVVE